MAARTILKALLCLVIALPLFASEVTGKYESEMKRPDGEVMKMTFDLKADGETLTGNLVSPRGERPISEGKVKGNEISFVMKFERDGNTMKMLYKGKVEGDELKLTMSSENGEFSRDMVAKRVK